MQLAALLAVLLACFSFAQAQLPELTSSDKATPITLQKLEVDVQIIGVRTVTTFSMTFHNGSDKILEGSFVLPLPEGASVVRYALDINGKMREGVPVEKAKAAEIFESVEKRRIDPGLLEKTEGNVFRTRIYPIPSHGERSIIIAYEQELPVNKNKELIYHLPLVSKEVLPKFSLNIAVQQPDQAPVLESSPIDELSFLRRNSHYCAQEKRDAVVLQKPLTIRMAKEDTDIESFVQYKNGQHYFYLQAFLPSETKDKKLPKNIALIWDASLSGLYRDTAKEIALLEHYLKYLKEATVHLYILNNTFRAAGSFGVQEGTAKELMDSLQKMVYDGGTDYSKIRMPIADETILFSDGLSTLSEAGTLSANHLVYTVSSSPKANYGVLKNIAEQNGGVCINLNTLSAEEGAVQLTKQTLSFLGIRKNTHIVEHYPSAPTPVHNAFSMAGKLDGAPATLTLQFGYGRTVALEKTVTLHADGNDVEGWNFARLLAQKKIAGLEREYVKNKDEILRLGKEYSIVTQNTSLLVLEDVMDYVRHRIEPPAELREAYKRLLKEQRDQMMENQQSTLGRAVEYSDQLWQWWNTTFPVKKKTVSRIVSDQALVMADTAITDNGITLMETPPPPPPRQSLALDEEVVEEQKLSSPLQGRAAGVQLNDVVVIGYGTRSKTASLQSNGNETNRPLVVVDGQVVSSMPPQQEIANTEFLESGAGVALYGSRAINGVVLITTKNAKQKKEPVTNLKERRSTADYLKVLAKTPRSEQYSVYVQLRDKNLLNPTFYYDVAAFFFRSDRKLSLQILTNLGELDYQNHELQKLFGMKLKEYGEPALQQYVFKKVLLWRPQEPQSYRDYALALAEAGKYQAALDTLYLALAKDYNTDVMTNYEGIEETIVMEINNLVGRHQLEATGMHKKLLRNMPVDIRVVLNWNMNDTDIDLWVTDPKGEKCFYNNPQTSLGGRLSEDFTEGYGPEQFLLKKAAKGTYKIQVHYYGENGVKIAGKTTLLVEVFTHYGRQNQQRKLITLQLDEEEKEGIYVGEFVF